MLRKTPFKVGCHADIALFGKTDAVNEVDVMHFAALLRTSCFAGLKSCEARHAKQDGGDGGIGYEFPPSNTFQGFSECAPA